MQTRFMKFKRCKHRIGFSPTSIIIIDMDFLWFFYRCCWYGIISLVPDVSERLIKNSSKTLNASQREYEYIHREAFVIIYGLFKYYQYLYRRKFMIVTDHKALISIFDNQKASTVMATSRFARWSIILMTLTTKMSIKTLMHNNSDDLSCLSHFRRSKLWSFGQFQWTWSSLFYKNLKKANYNYSNCLDQIRDY